MRKLLGMLGLAKRAGKVSTGTFICEKAIKSKTAKLVILAEDASDNTAKAINDACSYCNVRLIRCSTKADLGHAVGAQADRAVVCVNDNNFAKAILDIYNKLVQNRERVM